MVVSCFSVQVEASAPPKQNLEVSILSMENVKSTKSSIYNLGSTMKLTGYTSSYKTVDRISVALYLQVWDSANKKWMDYSSGKTYTEENDSYVSGSVVYSAPKGYFYRVKGKHTVKENGATETTTTYSSHIKH